MSHVQEYPLRPGIVTTVLLSLRSRWAARRSMQRIATALVGLMLVCGVGTAALGQTGMPTQSTNIPLSYVPVGSDYRLAINVGINGGPLQSYLFDTGSPGFNAAWNPATWNGFGGGTQAVPTSTIPNGNNVQFCYGTGPGNSCRGYLGNIVQVPSLSFQNPAGGLTTLTTPASGGFQMTAVAADNSVNQNPPWVFPGYFCNSPYSCPSNPNPVAPDGPQFYGIFGAGDFTSPQFGCSVAISLPSRCPSGSETPPVSVGSVLGQISVAGSNIAAQGFIVAANGQPNPGNTGGVSNPPFGTASVMIGGSVTPVTNCNPCVTVGLTPQLIGQFAPVGLPSQNPALPGLVPWARTSSHNFVNPYGATPGNNASLEYGANFGVSLTTPSGTTSTTSITLLDTGTTNLTLSQSLSSVGLAATSISMVGATPAGATIPGLPTTSASLTQGASPYSYAYAPFDANILGLPFFMQNSVMFDLSDRVIGYTPFFVTDAPLATTAGGPLIVSGSNVPLGLAGVISGPGGVVVGNGGAIQTSATNTYTGETSIIAGGMFLVAGPGSIASSSGVVNNGIFDISRAWAPISINTLTGSGTTYLGANTLVLTNASGIFSGVIADSGAYPVGGGNLTIAGGTQGLSGANSYSGATTIQSGAQLNLLGFGSIASSSGLANNGTFDISGVTPTGAGLQALTGSGQVNLGAKTLVILNGTGGAFSGVIADGGTSGGTGGGLLLVGGSQTLSGANTYTGQTAVAGGFLNLTGSIAGNALVGSAGSLGGTGTIGGNLINAGIVAPGGSYGTLNVSGSYTQAVGGTLYTQVNAAGQASQLAVGGAASLLGGTVLAGVGPGTYGARTTYTIVRATGGVTGAYASAASTMPFLVPSLSYDANDVYLTLQAGNFNSAAQTPTQMAVANALNVGATTATGDFSTVLGTLATLNPAQMPAVLNALSGQNYAAFSTSMTQAAQMFMNSFLSQAGGGSRTSGGGSRVALAEACDVESACDTTTPAKWGAWGGGVGGVGSVGAGTGMGAVTYNLGGFAAGLDRQITDTVLAGVAVGYTSGQQWVSGFSGSGLSNSYQVSLYGSYSDGPVYADGLAGYAYSNNQMWRTIAIPGLATRTAQASTGANQVFGLVEGGYRFAFGSSGDTTLAPFARLQGSTVTQNGFTETGAQSLDLTVAPQTTNSLRSVLGAQLAGTAQLGWGEPLALQVKLGWSHEYASTSLPVTATLAGAPSTSFTTYGLSPQRDGLLVGMGASTAIARATSLYARYEGLLSGSDSSHAFTAGVRMTW